MISRIKITDWRGIAQREILLEDGLNIIVGPNEAGKSTLVEALEKALFWDHSAHKIQAMKLDEIMPFGVPRAAPTVEIDVQVSGVTATMTKVVHPVASKRECGLRLRFADGRPDQALQGSQARDRFVELLSSDPSLRIARQGSAAQILEGLPASARDALVGQAGGSIILSRRLETVRAQVQAERDRALTSTMRDSVPAMLKMNTPEYRAWQDLETRRTEMKKIQAVIQEVSDLRRDHGRLQVDIGSLCAQLVEAEETLHRRQDLRRQQDQADKDLLEAKKAYDDAGRAEVELQNKADRIKELRKILADGKTAIAGLAKELDQESSKLQLLTSDLKEAVGRRSRAGADRDDAGNEFKALSLLLETRQSQRSVRDIEARLKRVQQAARELSDARHEAENLAPYIEGERIGQLRELFNEFRQLKRDAYGSLQLEMKLENDREILWRADGDADQSIHISAGEAHTLGAVSRLELSIPGIGYFSFRSGAAELRSLRQQITDNEQKLSQELALCGLSCADLPVGFSLLEERWAAARSAQVKVDLAAMNLKRVERDAGKEKALSDALGKGSEDAARKQADLGPFTHHLPAGAASLLDDDLVELQRQAETKVRSAQDSFTSVVAEVDRTNAAITIQTAKVSGNEAKVDRAKADEQQREMELSQLERDAQTDRQREDALRNARLALVDTERSRDIAAAQRDKLGPAVKNEELTSLQASQARLNESVNQKKESLAGIRAKLDDRCGQDPQGELERLTGDVKDAEERFAGIERKLKANLLLHAILEGQRRQISRALSAPLNQRISPWLQQIRGLPTEVRLNDQDLRIEKVLTRRGSNTEELPYTELSDGCKEQLAFVVRLVLAQVMADHSAEGARFVILDDPLTQTDRHRRPEMYRVLAQAAQQMQILFITCHQDTLGALPAQAHYIEM